MEPNQGPRKEFKKIVIPESVFRGGDDHELTDAAVGLNIDFRRLNPNYDCTVRWEISAINKANNYFGQVENGGHGQFLSNVQPDQAYLKEIKAIFGELGQEYYGLILDDLAALMDKEAERTQEAADGAGFGDIDAAFDELDMRLIRNNRVLGATAEWSETVADWVRTHPDLLVVRNDQYRTVIESLCEAKSEQDEARVADQFRSKEISTQLPPEGDEESLLGRKKPKFTLDELEHLNFVTLQSDFRTNSRHGAVWENNSFKKNMYSEVFSESDPEKPYVGQPSILISKAAKLENLDAFHLDHIPIVSAKIKSLMQSLCLDEIQFIPLRIYATKTTSISENSDRLEKEFFVLNPLAQFDCFDESRSDYRSKWIGQGGNISYVNINFMVLDERACSGSNIFTVKNVPGPVVLSARLAQRLLEEGIRGVRLCPPLEFFSPRDMMPGLWAKYEAGEQVGKKEVQDFSKPGTAPQ